jgi:hypothetical protein
MHDAHKHGEYYDGYLLDISVGEESEIITALQLWMCWLLIQMKQRTPLELIRQDESAQENDIEEMSTDAAGYRVYVFHKMESEEGLNVTL